MRSCCLGRELDDLAVFDGDALLGVELMPPAVNRSPFQALLCCGAAFARRSDARCALSSKMLNGFVI